MPTPYDDLKPLLGFHAVIIAGGFLPLVFRLMTDKGFLGSHLFLAFVILGALASLGITLRVARILFAHRGEVAADLRATLGLRHAIGGLVLAAGVAWIVFVSLPGQGHSKDERILLTFAGVVVGLVGVFVGVGRRPRPTQHAPLPETTLRAVRRTGLLLGIFGCSVLALFAGGGLFEAADAFGLVPGLLLFLTAFISGYLGLETILKNWEELLDWVVNRGSLPRIGLGVLLALIGAGFLTTVVICSIEVARGRLHDDLVLGFCAGLIFGGFTLFGAVRLLLNRGSMLAGGDYE